MQIVVWRRTRRVQLEISLWRFSIAAGLSSGRLSGGRRLGKESSLPAKRLLVLARPRVWLDWPYRPPNSKRDLVGAPLLDGPPPEREGRLDRAAFRNGHDPDTE